MTQTKTIGKFKPRVKFIKFVAIKGNVVFQSTEAMIEGKYLSGIDMDGVNFKLTLRDDDTIDFEEISETRTFSDDEKSRFIELICEKNIGFIRSHSVLTDLPFTSIAKINDKEISLHLEVEYQSPFSRLASLFEESEKEVTDSQNDKLDNLLSMFEDEDSETAEETNETKESPQSSDVSESDLDLKIKSDLDKSVRDSFDRMKSEKLVELERELEFQESELKRFEFEKNQAERKIDSAKSEIRLLGSRIETLKPFAEPNGYSFFVSERLNEKIELDESTATLIFDKVSKIKSINAEAFMKLFEEGEFQIRLGTKESESSDFTEIIDYKLLPEEIKQFLSKNEIRYIDKKLMYNGDMTWHDLVNKMIKAGFVQSPEFDKLCGSNSYQIDEKK